MQTTISQLINIKTMHVLILHNFYQTAGGEEQVLKNEINLLNEYGHTVSCLSMNNKNIRTVWEKLCVGLWTPFSLPQYFKLKKKLIVLKPDIVHIHNFFPLYSPSLFFACSSVGVPVVHTLHNFRSICPTSLLLHKGKIETKSVGSSTWWAIREKIYRGSIPGTILLVMMIELHKWLGTWNKRVDRYIALTEFTKNIYVEAGWPGEKISIKPNFIFDPTQNTEENDSKYGYALYLGRLSEEKGVKTLLDAWKDIKFPLKFIGEGPLEKIFKNLSDDQIEYLGVKDRKSVFNLIKNSRFLVIPSEWFEGFPMVLLEAFACGKPVIASNIGSLGEIVRDGETGLLFEPGNSSDLRNKLKCFIEKPERVQEMGLKARQEYQDNFTPERNYYMLMNIYNEAIKLKSAK